MVGLVHGDDFDTVGNPKDCQWFEGNLGDRFEVQGNNRRRRSLRESRVEDTEQDCIVYIKRLEIRGGSEACRNHS